MQGPEGQIFGPMADTYAFALGGALILALTVSPVLCLLLFRKLGPSHDNFFVRYLQDAIFADWSRCLRHRLVTLSVFAAVIVVTLCALPLMDREFMPELEEGNLWIRGTFPLNASLDEVAGKMRLAREIIRCYPEIDCIVAQIGRPDDGTDPTGFYNVEVFVPLRPEKDWPSVKEESGLWKWLHGNGASHQTRTHDGDERRARSEARRRGLELLAVHSRQRHGGAFRREGRQFRQIIGPDLDELERLADQVESRLNKVDGVVNPGVYRIKGQPNLEFMPDRVKCSLWGVKESDVQNAMQTAVGGKAFSLMIEGEKTFDITIRFPESLRGSEQAILNVPVDVENNTVTVGRCRRKERRRTVAMPRGCPRLARMWPVRRWWGASSTHRRRPRRPRRA